MKKLILAALIFALVGAPAAQGAPAAAPKFKNEYKMSVNISDVTPQGKAAAYFAAKVRERTGGKINIKVYWNGQLFSGKATNELLLMRQNVGDFSLSSFINWAPQFPKGNLFLLPFFISARPDKYKALDAVTQGKAGGMLVNEVAKHSLKVIGWGEQGARELTNNIRPIRTPEDMKDLKIRVVGSPLFIEIFKTLGANPMNISWAEAITALQQKTVDGQENPYSVFLPNKIYEFQKFLTEWSYNMDPLIFTVHQKIWDSLPADIQKIVADCADEAGMYNRCLSRLGLDDGSSKKWLLENGLYPDENDLMATNPRKFVEQQGLAVELLTPQEIKVFAERLSGVRESWIPKVGRDLVDAAVSDMDSVRY